MKVLLAILLALLATLYGLYLYKFPTYTYRYKVIVDVDVDGKIVSGSAVREVRRWEQLIVFSTPYWGSVDGEAVVVDLGRRGLLFATMYLDRSYTNDAIMTPERVFGRSKEITSKIKRVRGVDSTPELWRQLSNFRGCAELESGEMPLFVKFDDIKEPASVRRVDPNYLEASFGAGIFLRSVKICMVDESPSHGIENILRWIPDVVGALNIPPMRAPQSEWPFGAHLTGDAFVKGNASR